MLNIDSHRERAKMSGAISFACVNLVEEVIMSGTHTIAVLCGKNKCEHVTPNLDCHRINLPSILLFFIFLAAAFVVDVALVHI